MILFYCQSVVESNHSLPAERQRAVEFVVVNEQNFAVVNGKNGNREINFSVDVGQVPKKYPAFSVQNRKDERLNTEY